jgi:hypothetical protein
LAGKLTLVILANSIDEYIKTWAYTISNQSYTMGDHLTHTLNANTKAYVP